MKNKKLNAIITVVASISLLSTMSYANSSWHWLTKTRPFDILPYIVVITLLIEFIMIKRINAIKHHFRLLLIICLANIASFLLPFALLWLFSPYAVGYTFKMSINHLPKYIVGIGYLFLTLIAEIPVMYLSLNEIVTEKRKLFISIIIINVVTTILVAVIERIVCRGSW